MALVPFSPHSPRPAIKGAGEALLGGSFQRTQPSPGERLGRLLPRVSPSKDGLWVTQPPYVQEFLQSPRNRSSEHIQAIGLATPFSGQDPSTKSPIDALLTADAWCMVAVLIPTHCPVEERLVLPFTD